MNEKQNEKSIFVKFLRVIFNLALLGGIAYFVFSNSYIIKDYFANLNYSPSSEIATLADDMTLTNNARSVFYATRPSINDADEFNSNCSSGLEQTAVLGCYSADKIYIYNVKNTELDGIKETTAAHELLHAVWSRMSSSEQEDLKKQLNEEYEKIKTPELESLMAQYEISEPGEHENELHSILGTEFSGLSENLEKYYSKIFENRQKIVSYYENYNGKFEELEQRSAEISTQMQALKAEIDQESEEYQRELVSLNQNISSFNQNAKNGYYTNESDFYADREALQVRIENINQQYSLINNKIDSYNSLLTELQQISVKTDELNKSINSNLTTPAEL